MPYEILVSNPFLFFELSKIPSYEYIMEFLSMLGNFCNFKYSKGHKFLDINMSFTYYEQTTIV